MTDSDLFVSVARTDEEPDMSDTTDGAVLYLCPHNAAKSVLAVAYFRHYAAQADLPLTADSAGTEPDTAVWPSVVEILRQDGLDADQRTPRHVTADDLEHARVVGTTRAHARGA